MTTPKLETGQIWYSPSPRNHQAANFAPRRITIMPSDIIGLTTPALMMMKKRRAIGFVTLPPTDGTVPTYNMRPTDHHIYHHNNFEWADSIKEEEFLAWIRHNNLICARLRMPA